MFNSKFWLKVIVFFGLLLRLSTFMIGYHGDLNNNISWGKVAYERGLNGFYDSSNSDDWEYSAPNQPPLTILLLTGVVFVGQKVADLIWYLNDKFSFFPSALVWFWERAGDILMVKLPSILADLGIGFAIYKYFEHKGKGTLGLKLFALWIFNPVVWYNSAVWGQTDSVVNFLGFLAVLYILKKELIKFTLFFTLCVLFKGSLGIFIPVLFVYVLLNKYTLKEWTISLLVSIATITMVSIWFHPHFDLLTWLYTLYTTRILPGEIGFLTANAFNFWWLIDSGKIYDNIVYFGFSARNWGIVITMVFNLYVIYWLYKKPSKKLLLISLTVVSIASFLFMTRIHERYLYPFFPLATLLLGVIPHYWLIYGAFSLIHLLNMYNLFWVPSIPLIEYSLTLNWFTNSLAWGNLLLFALYLRHLRRLKI